MEIEKLIKHMRKEAQDYRNGRTLGRAFADAEDVLDAAVDALEQLQAELERVKQLYESEKEDFIDYACSGVPNLSPYCTNRHPDCVDERGWCRTEKCHGFSRNRDQKEDI